jgi:signal transduction histidine kinase/DNA-binding response OmpR family regulator
LLSLTANINAQQSSPRFEHIGVKDALPQPTAVVRAQDDQGFVWFASSERTMRRILHCLLVIMMSATLFAQNNWERFGTTPVLELGPAGSWEVFALGGPNILEVDDTLRMWYGACEDGNSNYAIGYAWSLGGLTWTKSEHNPVLDVGIDGSWDANNVIFPNVRHEDGEYIMWYAGSGNAYPYDRLKVGVARSSDPIHWVKDTVNNPVFEGSDDGSWDDKSTGVFSVDNNGSEYTIWYNGRQSSGHYQIGRATSVDGVTSWTRDPLNPIISNGAYGSWDYQETYGQSLCHVGELVEIFYSGINSEIAIGLAISADGDNFTKYPENPVFESAPAGAWDDESVSDPFVIYDVVEETFQMWYTGWNGNQGQIGYVTLSPDISTIVLTDFQLFHKSVPIDPELSKDKKYGYYLPEHISKLNAIELSYLENEFSFEFVALGYRNPILNQYTYKLEGIDKDWIQTDASNRIATYTNLDPGDYTFQVKGSNNDGQWNEDGVSLAITIKPPWWRTNLAYLGYFLLIIFIPTIFYRIRIARFRLQHQVELEHREAERYHEIDELKSRFFANISHEFRTPLTLILGPVGKMLTKLKGSEYDQDLHLMQRQAKRLLELVTQLLDLSKLEAGKMKIQVSQRNIIPLLKGLTLSFASLAERDKITLSFISELEDIQIFVDKDAISKIINNLLSNAFKFTESDGAIQVNVRIVSESALSSEGEICIAITDNGIGISTERVDKIFDRFYQVDSGETREREGTGIGLALTHELVELHKGSIGVSSEEGEGTTFTIRLPLGRAHLGEADIVETEEGHTIDPSLEQIPVEETIPSLTQIPEDDSQPILLIVEDNTDVRSYIRSYLDQEFNCFEAVDGEEGLKQALELIPDLIISDVMMPKMDGVEFCQRIKTDMHTSHIPVILLTAKADMESKLEGLETGADAYLTKPFEAEELLVRIKNLIAQRVLLRQRFQQDLNLIPEDIPLSSMDEQFFKKATGIISDQLQSSDFNVEQFSAKIFMSRQHLNRKLKALTGRSTVDFIRTVRLKRAAILLQHHESTITEISYKVGFANPSHFTMSFQKEFGKTPKDYLVEYQKSQNKE